MRDQVIDSKHLKLNVLLILHYLFIQTSPIKQGMEISVYFNRTRKIILKANSMGFG